MPVTHIDAALLTPEFGLDPLLAGQVLDLVDEVTDRTGLHLPDVEVRWMPAAAFMSQRDGDRYQAIHRPGRAVAAFRPQVEVTRGPEAPTPYHRNLGCPAAYILGQDVVIAARPPPGVSFPAAALAHALTEATVCRYLGAELDSLLDRYPLETLWDHHDGLSDTATRAYNKLYLLRATTLGLAQVAILERCNTLFSRSAMHRLWNVPMATTMTALSVALDPELQRIVPTQLRPSPRPSRAPSPMPAEGDWIAPRPDTPLSRSPPISPRIHFRELN